MMVSFALANNSTESQNADTLDEPRGATAAALTPPQERLLRFIREFVERKTCPPTVREIQQGTGDVVHLISGVSFAEPGTERRNHAPSESCTRPDDRRLVPEIKKRCGAALWWRLGSRPVHHSHYTAICPEVITDLKPISIKGANMSHIDRVDARSVPGTPGRVLTV